MISRLTGLVTDKNPPELVLDVNGVGYEVFAPMSTYCTLPSEASEPVSLMIHTVVREDAFLLYGFSTAQERQLFRQLLKINGVGAKLALAILSGMSVNEFAQCVESENATALVKLPGVGKKTAERLLIEMRDKVPSMGEVSASGGVQPSLVMPMTSHMEPAQQALEALGYKAKEAEKMLKAVETEGLSTEEWIRAALQAVARL